jgi:hypothetical protein
MENNYDFNVPKIDLPNATTVLVLGIISIVGCCCYGIVGVICGIIALVLAKSATTLYVSEPGKYTESSYKNLNTGKTCAWIGLILSILSLLSSVVFWIIYGFAAFTDPNELLNRFGLQ